SIRVLGDVQRGAQNRERSKAGRKPRLRALSIRAPMRRQTRLTLRRAFELALLGDALVRLARALDAVLLLVPLGGEHADHLEDAADVAAAEQAGNDVHVVADAELVSQGNLRITQKQCLGRCAGGRKPSIIGAHVFIIAGKIELWRNYENLFEEFAPKAAG